MALTKKNLTSTLLLSLFFISSCHMVKSILYLRPDHKDHKKFSSNLIQEASNIYTWEYFPKQLDPTQIQLEYKDKSTTNLEDMLDNDLTNAFLIIKDGKILFERYYNKYHADKTHGSFSVSKAMLATMLGLTLEENLISSYTDPITKYIPELIDNDSAFSEITIQHLFEMNSGIKVRGKDASLMGDLAKTYYGNNWTRFMKTIELDTVAPGERHIYNQTDAELLSLILTRVTGQSLADYFSENIWQKIGAEAGFWSTYSKDDLEKGFCCFNARIRDYGKFAQLYVQNGIWNGEQIIPKAWVDFTTKREAPIENKWIFDFQRYWFPSTDSIQDFTAQGYNGQMIYINPAENVSILRFGKKVEEDIEWEATMRSIVSQL